MAVYSHYRRGINEVSDKELRSAIQYFHEMGFVEELTTDKKHYVEILLKGAGNHLNVKLEVE